MEIQSNIWKLYGIRFFSGLIPAYVIERLYWEQHGMSVQMVVYTEILFAVSIVLLELPSGIAADRWGRKRLLVLSATLFCFEFLILLVADQFWHFALVVLLAAVAHAASSGAASALLYDSLLQEGRAGAYERIAGRMQALDIGAVMLAALSGSWMATHLGLAFNYQVSLISAGAALGFALLLREPRPSPQAADSDDGAAPPMRAYVGSALRILRSTPGLPLVLMCWMTVGAAVTYIDEFWQLYLDQAGIAISWFGLYSAALFLIRLPGSLLAHRLKRMLRFRTLLMAIALTASAGLIVMSATGGYVGLAAMLAVCAVAGVLEPLAGGYLQHRIDSELRATVGSFQSLGEHALGIVAGLGFGLLADRFGLLSGYGFLGALVALAAVCVAVASRDAAP
ncbi:MFS transporter [Paenibacillus sp. IB182496]|uniref:MFS transporter n=1 Tax=Paenibacillus sabuli TaxID=2772509 RepID=A0A927BXR2_9BACL|nr:MFS transporter [Paenibacillus sabuli]MBD2847359.1 MFS transporter [Paenibacillus sabuli]